MLFRGLSCLVGALILSFGFSCGNKNPKAKSVPKTFQQKFGAALSCGDLMEVKVNTKNLTYSYRIKEGEFVGQANETGSGKLLRDEKILGKHAFYTDTGALFVAIENEVVIGSVDGKFYVGVPERKEEVQLSQIVGNYNFVAYCPLRFPQTLQGTLQIFKDGTGRVIQNANFPHAIHPNTIPVTIVEHDHNVFKVLSYDGSIEYANFLPRVDQETGRVFGVIDFSNKYALKGIGFAQKQRYVSVHAIEGSYTAYDTLSPEITKGVVKGHTLIINNSINKNFKVNLSLNDPWTGVVHGSAPGAFDFFGIHSGKALYSMIVRPGISPSAFIAVKN